MAARSYPRWAAPPAGAVVGALLAARAARREDVPVPVEWLVVGAACGLAAGVLVWMADPPASAAPDDDPAGGGPARESVVAGVLAALSVLLSCFPGFGMVLAGAAVAATRRSRRWPRTAARAAAVASLAVTAGFAALVAVRGK